MKSPVRFGLLAAMFVFVGGLLLFPDFVIGATFGNLGTAIGKGINFAGDSPIIALAGALALAAVVVGIAVSSQARRRRSQGP